MYNKISCLIVGDTDHSLAEFAKTRDPNSYLVTKDNCDLNHTGTVYTSLGDLSSIEQFYSLLCRSNRIVVPDLGKKKWSDGRTDQDRYSMAWSTRHYCLLASKEYGIELESSFNADSLIDVPQSRLGDHPQIWIAGCSTTHGSGVNKNEVYWKSIVDYIDLPFVNLSRPGSSISWSADQLLRSDLCPGDVVIWGITTSSRFYWYDNDRSRMITDRYYDMYPTFKNTVPRFILADNHWTQESIIAVERVRNICEKIGVFLLLVGIHSDLDFSSYWMNYKHFIPVHGHKGLNFDSDYVDYGTDNLHPGPKTHAKYSRLVIQHLDKIQYRKNILNNV